MALLSVAPAHAGRRMLSALLFCGVGIATTSTVVAAQDDDALRRALEQACQQRMQALQAEERANVEAIAWEITAAGVRGSYLGYAPDFSCKRSDVGGSTPTARFNYQEVVYEKQGENARAARAAEPKPVEIRNVTLVLIYRDGEWR